MRRAQYFFLRELRVLRGKSFSMGFDPQAIFANLAEKERVKGHHSAEGRAIRTLSRALNGWSAGSLSRRDVIVLCDQAVEDWLNSRLQRSPWSTKSVDALAPLALVSGMITQVEAERLLELHRLRTLDGPAGEVAAQEVEAALEFCIELIDKHW
jgi:hypothetical protein